MLSVGILGCSSTFRLRLSTNWSARRRDFSRGAGGKAGGQNAYIQLCRIPTKQGIFHKKLAIFYPQMGVFDPKMNCSNCSTVAKHKNDVPTPLQRYTEEYIKKLPKNSLLSNFFRTFVVDLEPGSEHRKLGPFPMHELKLNNPLREQAAPRQI